MGLQPKVGGKLHLRLNTDTRPIANKYREGKLKSTLKRELNQYVKSFRGKRVEPPSPAGKFNSVAVLLPRVDLTDP